ncbi:MAG TPA: type II toxin-antitoxin system VapB family antitoxin [Parapedobacter sp.]|uniref:type II toxin-antitoxin system VapB family antitoxin n=1 Tax=Parapedobacter TaxID=416949 RepID=UPI002BD0C646|nr:MULTISPECIES: type II toxin-antitoxin system VapB family antitoxin [unclassified Parapedobacter]MEC3881471.1 type II toxin-antitoxin system VapB family antitoxin [Parapedobacter sp. 10938]HWK58857.1 type II toxin-antitoxin system VapB family antitoxin [Parapedobacter sp.]
MMRTTVDIPEELIAEAMALTNTKTKNQLIKEVLEAHIKRIKRKRLVALKGTLDFDIDLDTLRGREDVKI